MARAQLQLWTKQVLPMVKTECVIMGLTCNKWLSGKYSQQLEL